MRQHRSQELRHATSRSLKYSDYGRFLATTEKRKKSGIDRRRTARRDVSVKIMLTAA